MEKKGLFFEASETQADDTRDNPPFGHKRLKKKESEKKVSLKKKVEKQTYGVHTKKKTVR